MEAVEFFPVFESSWSEFVIMRRYYDRFLPADDSYTPLPAHACSSESDSKPKAVQQLAVYDIKTHQMFSSPHPSRDHYRGLVTLLPPYFVRSSVMNDAFAPLSYFTDISCCFPTGLCSVLQMLSRPGATVSAALFFMVEVCLYL